MKLSNYDIYEKRIQVVDEPQTPRRWTTKEQILKRIKELEKMPIRTLTPVAALNYVRIPKVIPTPIFTLRRSNVRAVFVKPEQWPRTQSIRLD